MNIETAEVGPESVGYRLTTEALVFGGSTLTATDIAVAAGRADIGDARAGDAPRPRLRGEGPRADRRTHRRSGRPDAHVARPHPGRRGRRRLHPAARRAAPVRNSAPARRTTPSPTPSAPPSPRSAARSTRCTPSSRAAATRPSPRCAPKAVDKAIAAGASPQSVSIVDFDEVPIPYLPGNATRIRVKAVGDLDMAVRV